MPARNRATKKLAKPEEPLLEEAVVFEETVVFAFLRQTESQ